MWEMYTGQRPYGNMKQQQLVEEVVMRGLRPKFPSTAPAGYVVLAQSAWSGSPQARPSFDEILTHLNAMLQQVDDREMDSMVNGSFGSMGEKFEYMQLQQQQAAAAAQAQQGGVPAGMDRRPSQISRRGQPQMPSPMGPGASPRNGVAPGQGGSQVGQGPVPMVAPQQQVQPGMQAAGRPAQAAAPAAPAQGSAHMYSSA